MVLMKEFGDYKAKQKMQVIITQNQNERESVLTAYALGQGEYIGIQC